jgi:hypothetical protein
MPTQGQVGLVLGSALALLVSGLPSVAAQERGGERQGRRDRSRDRSRGDKDREKGKPRDKDKDKDKTSPQPVQAPQAPADSPMAAVHVQCDEGPDSPLCQTVVSAAESVAGRRYRLIAPAAQEPLWAREPLLRGCRRDDCRAVIAEQLKISRLVQVIIQRSKKHKGIDATFVLYCAEAMRACNDATSEDLKREEAKLRRSVESSVEALIATQRLTAPLRLEVKPVGAKVTIVSRDTSFTRTLVISEEKTPELRLIPDVYTVRVSKPGWLERESTVTVSQAGASLQVQLQTRPVEVKFEWSPPRAKVLVDGEVVDPRSHTLELPEGTHRIEVLPPAGEPYDPLRQEIEVRMGMEPVRLVLQRLTELRVRAPRGYTVSVDNKLLPAEQLQPHGLSVEATVPSTAGSHTVSAVSWRGLQLSQQVEVLPRTTADVRLNPPSLVPGVVIGTVGVLSLVAGGVLLSFHDQPTDSRDLFRYDTLTPAAVLMGVGGAALLTGAIWFGRSAANHPLFYKPSERRSAGAPSRVSLLPRVGASYAGVLTSIQF